MQCAHSDSRGSREIAVNRKRSIYQHQLHTDTLNNTVEERLRERERQRERQTQRRVEKSREIKKLKLYRRENQKRKLRTKGGQTTTRSS